MQVYLGKWQETDVAVKVLLELEHLAPTAAVQPQDPATLNAWTDSPPSSTPAQTGDKSQGTVQGLQGVTDARTSARGQSRADDGNRTEAAIKALEREVWACTYLCLTMLHHHRSLEALFALLTEAGAFLPHISSQ